MGQKQRKYPFIEDYFENIDTCDKAYWLGFIAADGCVYGNSLQIGLQETDLKHLELFQMCINRKAPINKRVSNFNTRVVNLHVYSKKMIDDLRSHGILSNKSLTQKPIIVKNNLQKHFWRGVFDGDGSIHLVKKYWRFALTGNKFMIDGFKIFLTDNELYDGKAYSKNNIKVWQLSNIVPTYKIAKFLYDQNGIALERKNNLAIQIIKEYENKILVDPSYGTKHHSESNKLKFKINKIGNKHPFYGKKWIFLESAKLSKRVDPLEIDKMLSDGWILGRKIIFDDVPKS